jgi:hypothetical protein
VSGFGQAFTAFVFGCAHPHSSIGVPGRGRAGDLFVTVTLLPSVATGKTLSGIGLRAFD